MTKVYIRFILLCMLASLSGCQPYVPEKVLSSNETSLQIRQLQSKKFHTLDEVNMLSAGMEVLQDMGFMIKESETKLGVIVGSKQRETDNRGQRVALVTLSILLGDGRLNGIEQSHTIRVSLVTTPDKSKKDTTVRVNFQRQVYDMVGNCVKLETIHDPEIYQGFFAKLSKSVFLEAHQI